MKVSDLFYRAVKNVYKIADSSFTLSAFRSGDFDRNAEDPDYFATINSISLPINEAVARLSNLDRIPWRTASIEKIGYADTQYVKNGTLRLPISEFREIYFGGYDVKDVKSVYVGNERGNYETLYFWVEADCLCIDISRLRFREEVLKDSNGDPILDGEGNNEYDFYFLTPVQVQFSINVEPLEIDTFRKETSADDDWYDEEADFDLNARYGITNEMCFYAIEYSYGAMMEDDDAEVAALHISRAEQYFSNLDSPNKPIAQSAVAAKRRMP